MNGEMFNGCRRCGRNFASVSSFDRHRVGRHAVLFSAEHEDGRRCADETEMLEDLGMEVDQRARWRIRLTDADKNRLSALQGLAETASERAA